MNREEIKRKIAYILQSSEMWTYIMDSYHKTEDEETEEILEQDFDNILNKIIDLFENRNLE
jgi:hypothetical protein